MPFKDILEKDLIDMTINEKIKRVSLDETIPKLREGFTCLCRLGRFADFRIGKNEV